jgi:hypothetical protein
LNGKQLSEYMIYSIGKLFGELIRELIRFTDQAEKTIDLLRVPIGDAEQMVARIGRLRLLTH